MNNEIKQAIALEMAKRKMTYMAKEHPNIDLNADTWVEVFHTFLGKVSEADKEYAKEKARNRHSDW